MWKIDDHGRKAALRISRGSPPAAAIRVLLADDHVRVRAALRALLQRAAGIDVVGEAADMQSVLDSAARTHPDVIVLDLHMPWGSGLQTIHGLHESEPDCRVLILTMDASGAMASRAMDAGASGYLLKERACRELVNAIHCAAAGGLY